MEVSTARKNPWVFFFGHEKEKAKPNMTFPRTLYINSHYLTRIQMQWT
jgi:hypothetical protein